MPYLFFFWQEWGVDPQNWGPVHCSAQGTARRPHGVAHDQRSNYKTSTPPSILGMRARAR